MAIRRKSQRIITGIEELDKKLAELKTGAANKIARPAVTKGGRVLLKRIKAKVPPNLKDAKRALGMVVNQKGGPKRNQPQAKVGAAVGKAASKAQAKDKKRRGVGIGARNIHWFILGTGEREHKDGHRTGSMPPQLGGIVKDTATQAMGEVRSVILQEATQRLAELAKK